MKFLPENKKKKIWTIGILAVSVLGIVYINLFTGPNGGGDLIVGENDGTAAVASPVPRARSRLLPFGSLIDDSILSDERFMLLQAAPEFEVLPEELGNPNLFGQ